MTGKKDCQFILASKSPRRKELLEKAGFQFEIVPSKIDEGDFDPRQADPSEYAKLLALAKAKSVAVNFPQKIVVGADTIVDCDGRIIGKASTGKEAEQIVRLLFSRPHKVITGLAIVRIKDHLEIVESDTTIVYPKLMSEKQIAEHINSGIWRDKAGAYAIQEQGDRFVEKIDGSFTNVMGMPMELFEKLFAKVSK
jgi:septum formation protein